MKIFKALATALLLLAAPSAMASQATIVGPIVGPSTMATVMGVVNGALLAIQGCNSGTAAPANGPSSAPVAYQMWCDTTANPVVVKMYDGVSWVTVGKLNTSTHKWTPLAYTLGVGTETTPLYPLVVSNNTFSGLAAIAATLIHAVSVDGSQSVIFMDSNNGTQINGRAFGGTAAAPSATLSTTQLAALGGFGYTNALANISSGKVAVNADSLWTVSNSATNVVIGTTPTGTTTRVDAVKVQNSGGVSVGTYQSTDYGLGNVATSGGFASSAPATKTANYTMTVADGSLIFNGGGSLTLTLLSAVSYPGRWLHIKNIATQTVVSASSNVVPLVGGAAGTAILAATAGAWVSLQSDGANWIIMAGN